MPSFEHNALVEMFRSNPGLAPHLIEQTLHAPVPPFASARVVEATLDQLIPTEFRADLVIELRDAPGKLVAAVIVEVQLVDDSDKLFSWPVYVAAFRAKRRCPAAVLVIAPESRVATWAAKPIDLGFGLTTMRPFVLGPAEVPLMTDPNAATAEPELAILSARAHGNAPGGSHVVLAALAGLAHFDNDLRDVYLRLIYGALREPIRRALKDLLMNPRLLEQLPPMPPFVEELRAQGRAQGRVQAKRDSLLKVLAHSGVVPSAEQRALVEACEDLAVLDRWFDRALGATSADELFG